MSIELFEHNKTAYESAVAMLAETGKAAVIHPTGTGKSFIGFKLCEDNPDKTVCWLSPSRYIFKTQIENLRSAGFDVPENIIFFTYKKLTLLSDEEIDAIQPDIFVYDEYHRCGAPLWGSAINNLVKRYPNVPMLGLSATNVRYLDNQRDMADELFDGNIASEMTLGEAIVRGILAPPKYIMSVFSYRDDLERYEKRISRVRSKKMRDTASEYLEKLRRTLEKADGLDENFFKHMDNKTGKYIIFCSNIDAMNECIELAPGWFAMVDKSPRIYSVYSGDPESSRSFADFVSDSDETHLRLLYCIDALNEGIHLDGIDGVILFRPTISPIIYKQQIGRALSAGCKKNPVVFDIVNNIENLRSIDSIREEMEVAITYYRYSGESNMIVNEHFQVIDEVKDCLRLFNELEKTLGASWDYMYAEAKQYFIEHGNLSILRSYSEKNGASLSTWLTVQRRIRAGQVEGTLSERQIALLDEIGMRWESLDDISWNKHFEAYKKYVENGGSLKVPGDTVYEGVPIGEWLARIRRYRSSGIRSDYFTSEREKMLEDVGIIWDQVDYIWEKNYQAALEYYMEHGNLEVPPKCVYNGVKLYNWLSDLRKVYRHEAPDRNNLTDDQIARLNAIGMRWKSQKDIIWDNGFEKAKEYFEKFGAADAPVSYVTEDGFKLGVWLSKCRLRYANGTLEADRLRRLESINMVWNKDRTKDWNVCFNYIKEYFEKHGNINIPSEYKVDGVWLNKWLNDQKQIILGKRKGKKLSDEQIEKLYSLGFTVDGNITMRWLGKYNDLKHYYNSYGNLKLPMGYKDSNGENLYTWLSNQKFYAKNGKLDDRKRQLLSEIGVF